MNFLKVLWSDICNIFQNRFIRASVVAIIMIPLIYGGLYLAAFWDPYGKTENLPVAVVNLDQGGVMDEEKVNYGNDIVDKLNDNDDLDWKFVKTQKEAEEGLEGDKYYSMMVIPKDFTQRMADVDKGKLDKPQIIFVANKKKNYVVGLISDKVANALKQDVTKSMVDNFTLKVFDNLYELRDGMEAATDGTAQVRDGVTDLKDKVPAMKDGMDKLYDGSSSLSDKMKDASDGSNKLRDGIGTLNSKMPDLVDGVSRLLKGSSNLTDKVGDALDGSKKLRDGVTSLNDKMPDMTDGVNKLYDGSTSMQDGLHEVHDNMPKMVEGVGDLRDGAKKLYDGSKTLADSIGQLQGGAAQMQGQVLNGLSGGLPTKEQMDALSKGADALNGKMPPEDISTIKNLANGLGNLSSAANDLKNGVEPKDENDPSPDKRIGDSAGQIASIKTTDIQKASSNLGDLSTKLGAGISQLQAAIAAETDEAKKAALQQQLQQYTQQKAGVDTIKGGVDGIYNTLGTETAQNGLKVLNGSSLMKDGASKIKKKTETDFGSGLDKLYDGLNELYDKSTDLQSGTDSLYNGSQNLRDGVSKFKGTVPDLTNGVSTLSDGTRDLSDGLFKIHEGSKTLTEKLGELNQKVPDLQQGVQELNDGSTDLSDGLLKMWDGSTKLRDGIKTLKDKMPDLEDGANKLYEGIAQLNDKLREGAEELSDNLIQSSKAMGTFMSDPINLKDKPLYEVEKYGEGLSPYFISLALWVGALMMFFVITEKVHTDVKVGPVSVVLGKYLSYVSVGILQAILISFAVMRLGLRPSNVLVFYLFNIFLSFVFIAIIQNLIFLLGDVGRLIAVIVLVLQLTASNGTFPGELLPKFFKTIGPFLPFTYSISALREIDSGINHAVLAKDVAILFGYMIFFLASSVLLKRHSDNLKAKLQENGLGINVKDVEELMEAK